MPRIIITLSIEEKFIDKFLSFLKNLSSINNDKEKPIIVNSIELDGKFVAYPKPRIKERCDVGEI